MDKQPNCKFNSSGFQSSITKCAIQPNVKNCVVAPATKALLDPCVQQHVMHQGMQDPYVQHMPTNNAAQAAVYSARMGGEDHDPAQCDLM